MRRADNERGPGLCTPALTESLPGDTLIVADVLEASAGIDAETKVRNYAETPDSTHSDQVFREPMSALLSSPVGVSPDDIADISEQGFRVAATWDDYTILLAEFDAGLSDIEPEGPHADLTDEHPLMHWREQDRALVERWLRDAGRDEPSARTEQRRRELRRSEVATIIARDGRTTVDSALRRVSSKRTAGDDRWLKMCDACAHPFEARRDDARFCSDACRKRSARRSAT